MAMTSLTKDQFLRYLTKRRRKETLQAIGKDLGVSRQAVKQWIDQMNEPSRLVLLVAAMHIQMDGKRK